MTYVDFADVKANNPIESAITLLDLKVKRTGDQYRGRCPACDTDDERALVITPDKDAYFCHTQKRGGDVIALVAHIRGTGMKDAALFIAGDKPAPPAPEEREAGTLAPLTYLEYEHDAVQALGLDAETAETLGIGYAKKGMMRGHVAVPIWKDGKLAGYIGIKEAKLPPSWRV